MANLAKLKKTKPLAAPLKRIGTPTPRPGLRPHGNGTLGIDKPVRPGQHPPEKPKPQAQPPQGPQGNHPQFDEPYFRQIGQADERLGEDLSTIAGQRQNTIHEFGIDDPTNPFSRAEGLKQAFLSSQRKATQGMGARGMLYSGAHQNLRNLNTQRNEASWDDLRNQYRDVLNSLDEAERGARRGDEDAHTQAFNDFLARAPEADTGEIPDKPKPAAKPPKKPKPKGKGKGKK